MKKRWAVVMRRERSGAPGAVLALTYTRLGADRLCLKMRRIESNLPAPLVYFSVRPASLCTALYGFESPLRPIPWQRRFQRFLAESRHQE